MKLHPELRDKRQAHGKMAQVEEVDNEDDLEDDLAAAISTQSFKIKEQGLL